MPSFDVACAFFATSIILGIAPGPDNIFVLTQSALYGAKAGIFTTLGLMTGICVQTLAAAIGVAAIFMASPLAFNLLKILGATYLCWLAWQSFRAGAGSSGTAGPISFPGYAALYRRGIIMNVTNPKVCLFFLAFLPQFCNPAQGNMGMQMVFLGILFMLATLLVFFTVALLGGKLAVWFNRSPKAQIAIHKIAAMIFIGLALALVFTGQ